MQRDLGVSSDSAGLEDLEVVRWGFSALIAVIFLFLSGFLTGTVFAIFFVVVLVVLAAGASFVVTVGPDGRVIVLDRSCAAIMPVIRLVKSLQQIN